MTILISNATIVNEGKQYIPVPRVYNLFHESQIEFKDEADLERLFRIMTNPTR